MSEKIVLQWEFQKLIEGKTQQQIDEMLRQMKLKLRG